MLYLAFLFMVVIVLLNVLIAQVSDTYTKVLATAPEVYLSHQSWYMARIEQQKYGACLPCLLPRILKWCIRRIAPSVSCTHFTVHTLMKHCIYRTQHMHAEHEILRAQNHACELFSLKLMHLIDLLMITMTIDRPCMHTSTCLHCV